MANILTHPTNGAIYFDDGTAGSSTVTALTGDAVSLNYDGSAGLNITSYNTTSTDRFTIDGDSGRLFSVNDSLTGTIFSVNDAAGLPIIEVESTSTTDTITIGTYASNALVVAGSRVGIGTATPNASYKLDVVGAVRASTNILAGGDISASGNIETFGSGTFNAGATIVGNIAVSGTVDNRHVATDGSKLDLIAASANNYSLPAGSSSTRGGVKIGYTESGKNYPVELSSEKMYVNVPWTDTNTTYDLSSYATQSYVGTQITNLIDSSPAALNTLNELAAALGDDANFSTTVTNSISTKLPLAGGTMTGAINTNGSNIVVNGGTGLATTGNEIKLTTAHGYIEFGPKNSSHAHIYTGSPNFYFNKQLVVNGSTVWNAGNDGATSGLDADLLDGQQGSYYGTASAVATNTAKVSYNSTASTKLATIATSANNYSLPSSVVHDTEGGALHATDALSISGHTITLKRGNSATETVVVPDNNTVYTHPTGAGNSHIPSGGAAGKFLKYYSSGVAIWDTPSYIANTDTVYTHPTGAGNKHVPTGGAAGQFLKYSSSGTATWATPAYTTVGSRHTGNASGLSAPSKASIRLWDVSTATDDPSGASDGLVLTAGWDSSDWAVQQFHDFHSNDLYLRSKQNGTWMTTWDRVFHDTYHPNADALTTARTISLGGDLSGSASFDGSTNVTITAAVLNDSHAHTKLSGFSQQTEYDLIRAGNSNGLYMKARWDGATSNRFWDMGYVDGNGTFYSGLKVISGGDITYKGNEIWHSGNDGPGSGLDADTLDGYSSTAFAGAITAPNAPASVTTTIVGETIDVTFAASTTSSIDAYLVYSSIDGSDYGLISVIPPEDFSASMSVIDNAFTETGTQAYRVYAMKKGMLSSATTGSVAYTVSSADPTTMSVVDLNNAFYIQWNPPSSNGRFVSAYNVYKHEHATQNSLDRTLASLVYSGLNTNYMAQVSGTNNNNFHQFWVETTIA